MRPTGRLLHDLDTWTIGVDMGELPEPWNTAAERAGVRATLRGIGEAAGGTSHVTMRRLIQEGRTSEATIRKVVTALRVSQATIREWASIPTSDYGAWDPPAEAHRMTPRARAAVEELIRTLVEEGGTDVGTTDQKSTGPGERGSATELNPAPWTAQAARRATDPYGDRIEAQDRAGEENQDEV